ncbi:MAG: MerR family transcriptional regulator [Candidatus Onthomonas sp.]
MKINEVEALVGITKKNIRFYEAEGLLSPQRNRENGYRTYSDEDVAILRQIKLLRKLGLPLSEIRSIQQGTITLDDGLRRHLVVLERQKENLEQASGLCQRLSREAVQLSQLDGAFWLEEMDRLEREGAAFLDKQKNDVRESPRGAMVSAAVMIGLMLVVMAIMIWGYFTEPIPLGVLAVLELIPLAVIAGVLLALRQRLRDIGRGELDEASKY